jgi:Flp pilus assembly protein TadD
MAIVVDREGLATLRAARARAAETTDVYALQRDAEQARVGGDFEEAERLLQEALVADPEQASTWSMVGALEDELGLVSVAREAYRVALSLADDDATAMALARLHASLGEWDDALAVTTHVALSAKDEPTRAAATLLAREVQSRKGAS